MRNNGAHNIDISLGNYYAFHRASVIINYNRNNEDGNTVSPFKRIFKEAITCYDKVLVIEPENVSILIKKGFAYNKLRTYIKAKDCFDKAIETVPDNYDAWIGKGLTLLDMANYEEAVECFDKAMEPDPDSLLALYYKGRALYGLGNYDGAMEQYHRVTKNKSDYADAWYGRACCNNRKGEIENSLSDLKKAIEIDQEKYIKLAKEDECFENVRSNEPFQMLLKELDKSQ